MASIRLTTLLAAQRRALIRIDDRTGSGAGSQVRTLSEKTKLACQSLFDAGLIEIRTTPDGESWYRTTPIGRKLRVEGEA